jgi:hypothetical protein
LGFGIVEILDVPPSVEEVSDENDEDNDEDEEGD